MDGVDINNPRSLAAGFGHATLFLKLKAVHSSWNATHLFNLGRAYFGSAPPASQIVGSWAS